MSFTILTSRALLAFIITVAGFAITGCGNSSSKKLPALSETAGSSQKPTQSSEGSKIRLSHEDTDLTDKYAELCMVGNNSAHSGETLKVRDYHKTRLKNFAQLNSVKLKFGGSLYPAGFDYNNDGIEDFYLTVASYSYSSFREDWTDFYIIPGHIGNAETIEPNFLAAYLKRILFVDLLKDSLKHRNISRLEIEGDYVITAKVTPIKFKEEIFLKVEAQMGEGINNDYVSAYENTPDWTTFAKINHLMEIQPIC